MKTLIIDGNNLASRAFFTPEKMNFFSMIQKIIREIEPDRFFICFDSGVESWRHRLYDGYKRDRAEKTPELYEWLATLRNAFYHSDLTMLMAPEADDMIATIAWRRAVRHNDNVYIASSDQDLLQLVSPNVICLVPTKQEFGDGYKATVWLPYKTEDVIAMVGLEPFQIPDYKGLCGDKSDSIPGVHGIGPRKAVALLQAYPSIELLYEAVDGNEHGIPEPVLKKLIFVDPETRQAARDMAFLSKRLATLVEVDIDYDRIDNGGTKFSGDDFVKVVEQVARGER